MTQDDISGLIARGEGLTVEFKRSLPNRHLLLLVMSIVRQDRRCPNECFRGFGSGIQTAFSIIRISTTVRTLPFQCRTPTYHRRLSCRVAAGSPCSPRLANASESTAVMS